MKSKQLTGLTRILNSIHQPLPLNQKESQRLLESLTTSFRKHLDEEHGFGADEKHAPGHVPAGAAARALPAPSQKRQRPTDQHVHSILSNPLFNYDPSAANSATQRSASAKPAQGNISSGGALLAPGSERDPMDVFDEAVAKGMMNPIRAAGCLMAKHREIVTSASLTVQDAMAESQAGRRVVQWLRASGLERDLAFLSHKRLVDELVRFLVAEGHEELVWSWLAALMGGAQPEDASARWKQATHLLQRLVDSKASGSPSLDDAYQCLFRAAQTLPFAWSLLPPDSHKARGPLFSVWQRLGWKSTVLAWQHPSKPSESSFNEFSAMGHRNLNSMSIPNKLGLAHLALHHPTTPDNKPAIAALYESDTWEFWSRQRDASPNAVHFATVRLRSLGLDTVQYFAQRGMADEAQALIGRLQERMGNYMNILHSPRNPSTLNQT